MPMLLVEPAAGMATKADAWTRCWAARTRPSGRWCAPWGEPRPTALLHARGPLRRAAARLTSAYLDAPTTRPCCARAFAFARDAHSGPVPQVAASRSSSTPSRWASSWPTCAWTPRPSRAALLHDTVEDTKVTAEEVERTFNPQVARAGGGRHQDHAHRGGDRSPTSRRATIRKMFVAMSQGHPRHRHQAGRPPAQHAHAGGPARGPAHLQGPRDAGDLRPHRPPPRHQLHQVGAGGPLPSSTWSPTSTSRSAAW